MHFGQKDKNKQGYFNKKSMSVDKYSDEQDNKVEII